MGDSGSQRHGSCMRSSNPFFLTPRDSAAVVAIHSLGKVKFEDRFSRMEPIPTHDDAFTSPKKVRVSGINMPTQSSPIAPFEMDPWLTPLSPVHDDDTVPATPDPADVELAKVVEPADEELGSDLDEDFGELLTAINDRFYSAILDETERHFQEVDSLTLAYREELENLYNNKY